MKSNEILRAQLIDIVFEGRNKGYGAYELRSNYGKRLRIALYVMTGLMLSLCTLLLINREKSIPVRTYIIQDPGMANPVMPDLVKPVQRGNAGRGNDYSTHIAMVDSLPAVLEDPFQSGSDGVNGDQHMGQVGIPGGMDSLQLSYEVPDSTVNISPPLSLGESREATFRGGEAAWKKYLEQHIRPEIVEESEATPGIYKVIVRFVVSAEGKISEVVAETDFGLGFEQEAVRIIKKGPDWIPARIGGREVSSYKRQPVIFVVTER